MGSSAGQQGGAAPEEIQIMQIIIERRKNIFGKFTLLTSKCRIRSGLPSKGGFKEAQALL